MTTQARELAKLVNNSGDVNLVDDITLGSDGALLNFGADSDVVITHVHNTGLLVNSTRQLQFGDSGTYIHQSADGVLDLVSDTEIELNATTLDINANVDISGTLTVAGALDFGDAVLSNVGAVALDSISGDGDANTSITFSGSDVITITTGGETQVTFNNGSILPTTDNDIDLGSSSLQFKDAHFHGTVETDALTIGGTTLAETIADTVGAMVASNTETNIAVTYDDSDNTLDFVVGTLNQNTSGSAVSLANARTIHGVSFNGTADIDLSEPIQDTVGAMFSSNTETGIAATYQDGDGTIDLVIGDDTIVSSMLDTNIAIAGTLGVTGVITASAGFAATDGSTITVNDNSENLALISTDADANEGPILVMYRNSSSPADNDILGQLSFQGENSADEKTNYVLIDTTASDVTNGTEDGIFHIQSMTAGTLRSRLKLSPTETVFNEGAIDIDFRVEGSGFQNLIFANAGTDRVGIGTATPSALLDVQGAVVVAGAIDVDGITNLDVVDIDGAVDMATTLQVDGVATLDQLQVPQYVTHAGDTHTYMEFRPDLVDLRAGNVKGITIIPAEVVINEDSADVDFRVESNGSTHMLFVDGGANKILMSSNPASDTQSTPHDTLTLAVAYAASNSTNGAAGLGPRLAFKIPDDEDNPSLSGGISVVKESADDSVSNAAMIFEISQNDETLDEAMRITSAGTVTIATSANISQVALTSASTVAWDATAKANAFLEPGANLTIGSPSNSIEGAIIQIEIAMNGTARTIAWHTVFEFAASTAAVATATANKTDIFTFRYNGSVWQEIGRVQNMAQS